MQRPFLSRPAARPMRLRKVQPGHRDRIVDARAATTAHCAGVFCSAAMRVERQVVGRFGVEAEQEGAGEGIGDERHNRLAIVPQSRERAIRAMTQDQLKALVGAGRARATWCRGAVVGVGTGSTVNHFIDALATMKERIAGAVSSSSASTERLRAHGIRVLDANEVESLPVYIDGADEIDHARLHDQGRRRGADAREDRRRPGRALRLHRRRVASWSRCSAAFRCRSR